MAKPKKTQRRPADSAGIGPYARERERLVPMSEMRGWNVADGESDIRSWEVKTLSGKVLGTVKELLIDPDAGEVVMIDVDLTGSDRHALVPIRVVEIDRTRRIVRADSGDLEDIKEADFESRLSAEDLSKVRRDVRYADATRERAVEQRPVVDERVRMREPNTGETRW